MPSKHKLTPGETQDFQSLIRRFEGFFGLADTELTQTPLMKYMIDVVKDATLVGLTTFPPL